MRLTKSRLNQIIKEELGRKLSEQAQNQGDFPGSRADQQREIWGTSDEDLEREQIQAQADERGITFEEMEAILADLNSPENRREQRATAMAQARATAQDQGNWPEQREVSLDSLASEDTLGQNLYSTFWNEVCRSGAIGNSDGKFCGLGSRIRTAALDPGEDGTYPNLETAPPEIGSRQTVACKLSWLIDADVVGDRVQFSIGWEGENIAPGSSLAGLLDQSVQAINAASISLSSSLILVDDSEIGITTLYPMSDGLPSYIETVPSSIVSLVGSTYFASDVNVKGGDVTWRDRE